MPGKNLSTSAIQEYYDRISARYDWVEVFEAAAKRRAQDLLDLQPGNYLLNVGSGTGKDNQKFQEIVGPAGAIFGIDIAWEMTRLSHVRLNCPIIQTDARRLPCSANSFDRLYAAYLLDLMPTNEIPALLGELLRVLKPGGRMVLLSLTEGATPAGKFIAGLWKLAYRISPVSCGGCRPIDLSMIANEAGYPVTTRQVISQVGIASEIIVIEADDKTNNEANPG